MEDLAKNFAHIKGWGIDADPKNDPTYPMRHREKEEEKGYTWERPAQQPVNIEVLHSNERPNVSAVFGTSAPPTGLSGQLRRYAFKYSESSFGHWIPLLLADRVNVVEGIIDDIRQGHVPNIFAEKGWGGDWKYDRKGLVQKVLIGAAITTVVFALLNRKPELKRG
ncbi:hypothetical protein DYU11_10825 [Fibrisoma montanum]|uniref:Uncharacterized protein n=1 Tax=Fibrisoma montanum TaxID=2305895 RepID=A0A418MAT6_9BACT|nr:hypothetical protein [Fibrisoma montanum]RIV23482.1 hypothetical protein DYU11_10825 [Fibrisoma montanum]